MISAADNALFLLRYSFDFTLSGFSHQKDTLDDCPNRMMQSKHQWHFKSSMTHKQTIQLNHHAQHPAFWQLILLQAKTKILNTKT